MSAGAVAGVFSQIVTAPLYAVPPLLQTTAPHAPPGGLAGEATGIPSQLAKGNLGGPGVTAGVGVTTDNVA
jgi:hypothetical protein